MRKWGIVMSEFLQFDDDRKTKILEAALDEFAARGYRKASTNSIVKKAGVSKGLLFHYYTNKKELYILLYKSAIDTIVSDLLERVNLSDHDVLNRISQSVQEKINAYHNHPQFVKLLEHNHEIEDEEILQRTNSYAIEVSEKTYQKLFSDIDFYQFDDEININLALNVIRWTIDRISSDWIKKHNYQLLEMPTEGLVEEIEIYLNLFRNALMK